MLSRQGLVPGAILWGAAVLIGGTVGALTHGQLPLSAAQWTLIVICNGCFLTHAILVHRCTAFRASAASDLLSGFALLALGLFNVAWKPGPMSRPLVLTTAAVAIPCGLYYLWRGARRLG